MDNLERTMIIDDTCIASCETIYVQRYRELYINSYNRVKVENS